jgi:hypothetical protein
VATTALNIRANVDIATGNTAGFKSKFISACASALSVPSSRFQIVSVAAGSVIVTMAIVNDAASFLVPAALALQLQQQAISSTSALNVAMTAANIPIDTTFTPTATVATACYDGTYAQPCPELPYSVDWTYVNYGLYGIGALLVIILFCAWRHHTASPDSNSPKHETKESRALSSNSIEVSQL